MIVHHLVTMMHFPRVLAGPSFAVFWINYLSDRTYAEFLYDNPGVIPQQLTPDARRALTLRADRPLEATMDLLYTFTSRRDRGNAINKKWLIQMLEQIRIERFVYSSRFVARLSRPPSGDPVERKEMVLAPTGPLPESGTRRHRGRVPRREFQGLDTPAASTSVPEQPDENEASSAPSALATGDTAAVAPPQPASLAPIPGAYVVPAVLPAAFAATFVPAAPSTWGSAPATLELVPYPCATPIEQETPEIKTPAQTQQFARAAGEPDAGLLLRLSTPHVTTVHSRMQQTFALQVLPLMRCLLLART